MRPPLSMRPEPVSLVAGVTVAVLGVFLLLDDGGSIELGWGWLAAAACAAVGVILVASGLARRLR